MTKTNPHSTIVMMDRNGHRKTVYVRLKPAVTTDKKVKERQSTIVETDAERNLSFDELRKECLNFVQQQFQGKTFTNKATGREIHVSRQGIGEWKMKSKTREQVLSIKILDQLLEDAVFDHDAADEKKRLNVDSFSYFNCLCVINGTPFHAIITVKRTKDYGDKYYHHYLEGIKIEPCSGTAPTLTD